MLGSFLRHSRGTNLLEKLVKDRRGDAHKGQEALRTPTGVENAPRAVLKVRQRGAQHVQATPLASEFQRGLLDNASLLRPLEQSKGHAKGDGRVLGLLLGRVRLLVVATVAKVLATELTDADRSRFNTAAQRELTRSN